MKRWIYFGLLCLTACRPQRLELETYYLQIKDVHLRAPSKYVSFLCSGLRTSAVSSCLKELEAHVQHPPGWRIPGLVLLAQDFYTFELYKAPDQGLSDSLRVDLDDPDQIPKGRNLPNYAAAWNSENRDAKNDIYGLSAYKKVNRDDINYRYDFESGEVLFMTCAAFEMPNPGCSVSTSWRGLTLRYDFRHRHISEWRNLHQRITNHFNSFVYQP